MSLKLFICLAPCVCGLQWNHTLHKHKLKTLEIASLWEKNKHIFFFFFFSLKTNGSVSSQARLTDYLLGSVFFIYLFFSFFSLSTASNPCLRMSCDFMCLLNPTGARCTCPEGKVLVNGTCSDAIISGRHAVVGLRFQHGQYIAITSLLWYENT